MRLWRIDSSQGWPEDGTWYLGGTARSPHGPSITKRTLKGGLSHGVEVVEMDSGPFKVEILPGRGMGLWKADCDGLALQWDSPVKGPVHPQYVQLERRGGLGWLDGFNELLCRCGLAFNGPPGKDQNGYPITLHGRIANLPAHSLVLEMREDTGELSVTGSVLESSLFDSRLELTTTYSMTQGSRVLKIRDQVVNQSSTVADFQLLYHFNLGRPLLGAGCKLHAPVKEMSPQTPQAARSIGQWDTYAGPVSGFAEEVYLFRLHGGADHKTLAVLENPQSGQGVAVRFRLDQLPCFTVWKQTGADQDAFVTGLEPATGFPNFKDFERQRHRVVRLEPGQTWVADWSIEPLTSGDSLARAIGEVKNLSGTQTIHPLPHPEFTPHEN